MIPQVFDAVARFLLRTRPFRPFTVEFITGVAVRVSHPDGLRLRGVLALVVERDGHYAYFDATGVCRLVTDPSPLPSTS
jgi:hypothetical protein